MQISYTSNIILTYDVEKCVHFSSFSGKKDDNVGKLTFWHDRVRNEQQAQQWTVTVGRGQLMGEEVKNIKHGNVQGDWYQKYNHLNSFSLAQTKLTSIRDLNSEYFNEPVR